MFAVVCVQLSETGFKFQRQAKELNWWDNLIENVVNYVQDKFS